MSGGPRSLPYIEERKALEPYPQLLPNSHLATSVGADVSTLERLRHAAVHTQPINWVTVPLGTHALTDLKGLEELLQDCPNRLLHRALSGRLTVPPKARPPCLHAGGAQRRARRRRVRAIVRFVCQAYKLESLLTAKPEAVVSLATLDQWQPHMSCTFVAVHCVGVKPGQLERYVRQRDEMPVMSI